MSTSIEWTDATWNPVRGCSRVSEGCRNCYAERLAARFSGEGPRVAGGPKKPFYHFAAMTPAGPRWTGKVELMPSKLDEPLRWRKPRRVFVNSMSDLFHEALPDQALDQVFEVMERACHHTFQILTKRPKRMLAYCGWRWGEGRIPSRHIWLGVSVEDQATADERIPLLLQTPAAVHFVSYEPALGPVSFEAFLSVYDRHGEPSGPRCNEDGSSALAWVIVGGESGPGARPFELAWARSTVRQCREAGVACFVKQLGARAVCSCSGDVGAWARNHGHRSAECARCGMSFPLADPKGGDPSEWPEDLRVREFPA